MKLTPAQKIAVELTDTDILVSAGAGSGKTHVLAERFLNFVIKGKAGVNSILTLTFTEKAAHEMKLRIRNRFRQEEMLQASRDLESAYISTIHAFAARLLKEHPIEAGVPPDFAVMESEEAEFLQDEILDEMIEAQCLPGQGAFDLLKVYGETRVKEGIKDIFAKARIEGMTLTEEFGTGSERDRFISNLSLSEPVPGLLQEWRHFQNAVWDWNTLQEFREWSGHFGRRGGKNDKQAWREMAAACRQLVAKKLDGFAKPWREKLEGMALAFEAGYEARKFEKGVLDFEDLQLRALQLLTSPHPGCRKVLQHYRHLFKFILVDEYQDVNPLQARLIECFGEKGDRSLDLSPLVEQGPREKDMNVGKMFFVGDYKQSIYGFRGTSPHHFLAKEKEYEAGQGILISMMDNFRTQENILYFVNAFFERLWEEEGVKNIGLIPQKPPQEGKKAELLVVHRGQEEEISQARFREAGALARRIQELAVDGVAYGDMAILFQTVTHIGIYEYALKTAGIPYFVISGKGFYHQPEIRDMVSLLKVIENPLWDIPLAAVLRSPFFRVSDDDLFWLSVEAKREGEKAPLFEGLKRAENAAGISEAGREKLKKARGFFERLAKEKDRFYLSELLEGVLRETPYELSALADRQGVRRYANLRKLVQLAREKEARARMSLGNFIRLVESLESKEVRESEAQVEAEESGRTVKLMTIHKAKGLEFPVCFVADLACKERKPESKFVAESGLGYSFEIPNEITGKMERPGLHETIRAAVEGREAGEWKRLFYVAATRAKERLILSGVHSPSVPGKSESHISSATHRWTDPPMHCGGKSETNSNVPKRKKANVSDLNNSDLGFVSKFGFRNSDFKRFSDMNSWMDWVMALASEMPLEVREIHEGVQGLVRRPPQVYAEEKEFREILETLQVEGGRSKVEASDAFLPPSSFHPAATSLAGKLPPISPGRVIDLPVSAFCAFAKNPLEYWRIYELGYPPSPEFGEGQVLIERTSESEEQEDARLPARQGTAADFGTKIHKVLELLDFKNPEAKLAGILREIFRGETATRWQEARGLMAAFVKSELFKRLQSAKKIYRELRFVLNERHGRVDGVIDVLFQDAKGDWHILDYKAAVGDAKKVRESAYDFQIGIYAAAVAEILGIAPQSGMVVFLKNNGIETLPISADFLKTQRDRLRQTQQAMMDYRNARIAL